ncbi:MAG: hypothetical protein H3C26_00065 [Rhodocyclaceae bacterium]|nr:hypothetical protein [Rhodocyclaceae bacterium]
MKRKTPPAAPAEPKDSHAGMGGSYAIDPATGERKLVSRTRPAGDQPEEKENGDAQS